jgi:serine/threonine protein phosphatase PrpC
LTVGPAVPYHADLMPSSTLVAILAVALLGVGLVAVALLIAAAIARKVWTNHRTEQSRLQVEPAGDVTRLTFEFHNAPTPAMPPERDAAPPADGTRLGAVDAATSNSLSTTRQIVVDEEATLDQPTGPTPLLMISGKAQTDRGLRRKRNEDSFLILPDELVYVVADGMGGYAGGEVASQMAVQVISEAYQSRHFEGGPFPSLPREAQHLAMSVHMANWAIRSRAASDETLREMGTTVVAARFAPRKGRVYFAHVGDSRAYRLRDGQLRQLTVDHTLANEFGVTGKQAEFLTRAVGVDPAVRIDIVIAETRANDIYLLCSDGLNKMASAADIESLLVTNPDPDLAATNLVAQALAGGGRDNITVVVLRVQDARELPTEV